MTTDTKGPTPAERIKSLEALAADPDKLIALTFEQLAGDLTFLKGQHERQKAELDSADSLARQEREKLQTIYGLLERLKAAMTRQLSQLGS